MSNETRAKIVKSSTQPLAGVLYPHIIRRYCIQAFVHEGHVLCTHAAVYGTHQYPNRRRPKCYGIVQTIGLIAGIYICDMFSKKYMIGGS